MDLRTVLSHLDPTNDDHWTSDGLPRVGAVVDMIGQPVTREQITEVAPKLTRETLSSSGAAHDGNSAGEGHKPKPAESSSPSLAPWEGEDGLDDVLRIPLGDVMSDRDMLEKAIASLTVIHDRLSFEKEQIQKQLKIIAGKIETAEIGLTRLPKREEKDSSVKDYLRKAQEARAERAARAQRYIEAGTTAQDVAKQLQMKAPIDSAMGVRKPSREAKRPERPLMSR